MLKKLESGPGFTLIEVLIGVAILAAVGVALIAGLGTVFKSNIVANTQTTGMSIAQSQLEFTAGIFSPLDAADKVGYYNTAPVPEGYSIWTVPRGSNPDGTGEPVECTAASTDPKTGLIGIPWDDRSGFNQAIAADSSTDKDIQKITVIVRKDAKIVTTLSAFRVQP
jgi:prepilin-type N-terminal cleavage/methylation domain-containing protein